MYKTAFAVVVAAVLGYSVISQSDTFATVTQLVELALNSEFQCRPAPYTMRILMLDPLIIHLENFITPAERRHLLQVSAPTLERSKVAAKNGSEIFSTYRTSLSTYIDREDVAARCIYDRVSEFQGYEPVDNIESIQVTAYAKGQQFRNHFDWYGSDANVTKDRITTFFGILEADCDNCGTHFPDIPANWTGLDERWCRIVDCNAEALTVLPLPGSALFWRNLHMDNTGDRRTRHAGLPLSRGTKTGLNIWTLREIESLSLLSAQE